MLKSSQRRPRSQWLSDSFLLSRNDENQAQIGPTTRIRRRSIFVDRIHRPQIAHTRGKQPKLANPAKPSHGLNSGLPRTRIRDHPCRTYWEPGEGRFLISPCSKPAVGGPRVERDERQVRGTRRRRRADANKTVTYWLRWVSTRGETGPWSAAVSAIVPARRAPNRPFDAPAAFAYNYRDFSHCPRGALARGSREPGQALTGAAISDTLLVRGPLLGSVFGPANVGCMSQAKCTVSRQSTRWCISLHSCTLISAHEQLFAG